MTEKLDKLIAHKQKQLHEFSQTTSWSRNKKMIICVSCILFSLWIFAVSYTYYWLPKIYSGVQPPVTNISSQHTQPNTQSTPSPIPVLSFHVQAPNSWKIYQNNLGKFALAVPPQWSVENYETLLPDQDVNQIFLATATPGYCEEGMEIWFPISIKGPHHDSGTMYEQGLSGLEKGEYTGAGLLQSKSTYTMVAGYRALVNKQLLSNIRPKDALEWCGGNFKNIYVDLSDGRILTIKESWFTKDTQFEKLADKVMSTLQIQP